VGRRNREWSLHSYLSALLHVIVTKAEQKKVCVL
jgi:hypothetical protein